jgi:hypothetical protein
MMRTNAEKHLIAPEILRRAYTYGQCICPLMRWTRDPHPEIISAEKNSGDADMITTRPISGSTVSLDAIVARLSIERFCKIIPGEPDETKRHTLVRLIAEEKAKLCALVASPAM